MPNKPFIRAISEPEISVRSPIGIFDSGIGGLTVVQELHKVLPYEDMIYLGDTARVPYGTKSPETVVRFACEDTQFLIERRVKAVVVACNTASAWALPVLEQRFQIPVFGVIIPGARAALARSKNLRIGVIGTNATIKSQAYNREILARNDQAQIFVRPCPLLVPLVEEGWTSHSVTLSVIHEYLEPMLRRNIDTLVLGCTHYPLLKKLIRSVAGKNVTLVDSAETCARYVLERLGHLNLLRGPRKYEGKIYPCVTDDTERFEELAAKFLKGNLEPAVRVQLG